MKSDDKIKNMKQAIIKSGFPLEIFTASVLKSKYYNIIQHQYYLDKNENKLREIDLVAEKSAKLDSSKKEKTFVFQNTLIIECKKQEQSSPWLFFEGDDVNQDSSTLKYTSTKNYIDKKWVNDVIFPKTHYYNKIPCVYYIPPFKLNKDGKKSKDYIHETILQLISAVATTVTTYSEFQSRIAHKRLFFYYPLIVLDGDLYSSKISDAETIEIIPRDHVQLLMNVQDETRSEKWGNKKIVTKDSKLIIDIVKKEYLSDFLDNIILHGERTAQKQRLMRLIKK